MIHKELQFYPWAHFTSKLVNIMKFIIDRKIKMGLVSLNHAKRAGKMAQGERALADVQLSFGKIWVRV